jgi:predicted nucleic acid-binding protein
MRVLVDTCVWSLALRRQNKALLHAEERRLSELLSEAIRDGRVVMIGPVRQELLSGIRDKAQFAKTQGLLEPSEDEELTTADYVAAARCFNLCRARGVQWGGIDMLLCAVAARRHCAILTSDQGLLRCIEVLRAEKVLMP